MNLLTPRRDARQIRPGRRIERWRRLGRASAAAAAPPVATAGASTANPGPPGHDRAGRGNARSFRSRLATVPLRVHVQTRMSRARERLRDLTYGTPDPEDVRRDLARRYLRGSGLEIGALHRPLRVAPGIEVRYVDRLRVEELRVRYPEYASGWVVNPTVIDDSATLATVADASVDFVVANHVLEHMEDPIGTLRTWLRVVRDDGTVYLTVPDKRATFDRERPSTSAEHLRRDADDPAWSRQAHLLEYARLVEGLDGEAARLRAAELDAGDVDVHFHVWDRAELIALLVELSGPLSFEVEVVQANGPETIAILGKR